MIFANERNGMKIWRKGVPQETADSPLRCPWGRVRGGLYGGKRPAGNRRAAIVYPGEDGTVVPRIKRVPGQPGAAAAALLGKRVAAVLFL